MNAAGAGAETFIPLSRGSIMGCWPTEDGKYVYPLGVYPSGMVVLRLGYLKNRPAFAEEAARGELYQRLESIVGPLHTRSLAGEPGFRASLLLDDDVAERLRVFLEDVIAEGRRG